MRLTKKGKKFEFERARLGKTAVMATPIFVSCSLFLTPTHSENLID